MFRDPYLNDNGAQKRADTILAETANDATRWISKQEYQCLCVSVFPACLEDIQTPRPPCGGTIYDFPTPDQSCAPSPCYEKTNICVKSDVGAEGVVVLERKHGGRPDCTAEIVKIWELDGTAAPFDYDEKTGGYVPSQSYCCCRGFYRLRVVSYNEPLRLTIERVRAKDAI